MIEKIIDETENVSSAASQGSRKNLVKNQSIDCSEERKNSKGSTIQDNLTNNEH